MAKTDEVLQKALIRLHVLCETVRIDSFHTVSAMYVTEFEAILQDLRDSSLDVIGFEIPDAAIAGLDEGVRNCYRDFFAMKLAGLILHLSTVAPETRRPDPELVRRIVGALRLPEDPPF